MESVHDLVAPLVTAYPLISVFGSLVLGFALGVLVMRKKKKDH